MKTNKNNMEKGKTNIKYKKHIEVHETEEKNKPHKPKKEKKT